MTRTDENVKLFVFDDLPDREELLAVCDDAVEYRHRPAEWRESEYAMTKACAQRTIKQIRAGQVVTLFDLNTLIGEVARWMMTTGKDERESAELRCFLLLKKTISDDPDASFVMSRWEARAAADRKIRGLRARIAKIEADLDNGPLAGSY